jgi:hypothetical protein
VGDWIAIAISLVALGVSALAYWSGLPRLKLTATDPAIIVNAPESWGDFPVAIGVTLTNDGGAPAQINRVLLGADGVYGKVLAGRTDKFQIEARGGTVQWQYDVHDLRAQLGEKIKEGLRNPDEHLFVQATAQYGRKITRSKAVRINVPGDASARPPSRKERLKRYVRSWTRPQVTFGPAHRITRDDVNGRVARLEISNLGRARSKPHQLVVVVHHADLSREIVETVPPLHVPSIRGGRAIEVFPSYVDDSNAAAGDSFWWALRDSRGRGGGTSIGATTLSDRPKLEAALVKHEAERNKDGGLGRGP